MHSKTMSILGAAALTLAAQTAPARPVAVLLHPGGALVQEEVQAAPDKDGKTLRVVLPPMADPQSLDLIVPDHAVAALRFEETEASAATTAARLRDQLEEVGKKLSSLQAEQNDLDARRKYWSYPPTSFNTLAAVNDLDAAMREHLQQLRQENLALADRRAVLDKQAEELKRRIEQTGGDAALTRQAVIELADPASGPLAVRFAYSLPDAGWLPLYRLEALPDKNEVALTLEAEIWQRSGTDWAGVPLVLSTADPRQGMSPPRLSEWIVRPQPPMPQPVARSNQMMLAAESDMMEPGARGVMAKASAPVYMDGASFESWDIGSRDVPAGPSLRLPLHRETLKADFSYLLRPSRTEAAYLSAKLNMPELRHFPAGEALFLVDGVTVGKAPFSLSDDENRIYFGRDPQVTAILKKNSQQSGKQGIIDRKQTYTWDWTITVFNKHRRPVDVRVEEPAPQSRDEQIAVNVTSKPEAAKEDHNLVWSLEVPGGQSSVIRHTVTLTAPPDMTVWEGR